MTFISPCLPIEQFIKELDNILEKFDINNNNSLITTNSGRQYRVAHVVKENGNWKISNIYSREMNLCPICYKNKLNFYIGNTALQISHHTAPLINVRSSFIHVLNMHPENINSKELQLLKSIFID